MSLDLSQAELLPQLAVVEFEERLGVVSDVDLYTDAERSDAHERLGVALFFNGDIRALAQLQSALAPPYATLKSLPRVAHIKVLLGILHYRKGDLEAAEESFVAAAEAAKSAHLPGPLAGALANLAAVRMRQGQGVEAVRVAKSALEIGQTIYNKASDEYLELVRVLLGLLLKEEEFGKAEAVLAEHELPHKEKVLIQAGIKFALGDYLAAADLLSKTIDSEAQIRELLVQRGRERIAAAAAGTGAVVTVVAVETSTG
eukprot:CAMPEP_0173178772 /NCGR_PEP_ID=MMETSP1141-20130122/5724_1 /TAXON_ID=483371 /ORGANISM="non described non described, Strain CCMP2298" /LENGTH=257 /DNA_ID=CAMNT_0014101305 /DNA_START=353 /DNA_END=1123 /DNA_ORIENTATION=-